MKAVDRFVPMPDWLPQSWQRTLQEFIQYVGVGGVAFLVDFGVLTLALTLGAHHLLAAALGFSAGLVVCFALCVTWVWRGTQARGARDFLVFAVIGIVGFGLTLLGMWLGVDKLHLHPLLTKIVVSGFVLAWNFTLRKLFVFFR